MYGDVQAQEEFGVTIAENLDKESTFVPGISYNEDTIERAGVRYIPSIAGNNPVDPVQAGNNNYDFSNAASSMLQITCNNEYLPSKRIYNVQASSVPYDIVEGNVQSLVKDSISPSKQQSLLACLAYESTTLKKANNETDTTELTVANIKQYLVNLRKALRKAGARTSNQLQVSCDVYGLILQAAGSEFTADIKNQIAYSGNVGQWLGFTIWENAYIGGTYKYFDYAGNLRTVDTSSIDMIAYDGKTLYCDLKIEKLGVQDATTFNGVEIVSDLVLGARNNASRTLVKYNSNFLNDSVVTVAADDAESIYEVSLSDIQTSVAVGADNNITGTLLKQTGVNPLTAKWGEGYFVALKFTYDGFDTTTVKVGMNPSVSSGLVALTSNDDGVFKVTDKSTQKFVVEITSADGRFTKVQEYDLSGLTLSE